MQNTEQITPEQSEKTAEPAKKPSVLKALFFSVLAGVVTYFVYPHVISCDPDAPGFFGVFVAFALFFISLCFILPKLYPEKSSKNNLRAQRRLLSPYDIRNPGYYTNLTNPSNPTYIHRHQTRNH